MLQSNYVAPAGPKLAEFEAELSKAISPIDQTFHTVALNSGTAGIHLALLLAGVQPGDEVVSASLTFVGAVNPIIQCGAQPVFADSETETWNLDPYWLHVCLQDRAEKKKTVRAVIVTHLFGRCANIPAILDVCREFGVAVVEDAAESMGATLHGRTAGTWGNLGVYSFNGNKVVTTGGGGALVTPDPNYAAQALYLATQARDSVVPYAHSRLGYNYRMSNVLAGVGVAQLHKLNQYVQRRRAIYAYYQARLGSIPGISFLHERPGAHDSVWLSTLRYEPKAKTGHPLTTKPILDALEAQGIESRPVWTPLHTTQLYQDRPFYGSGVCTDVFRTGLCLPSGSALTEEQLDEICRIVERVVLRQ